MVAEPLKSRVELDNPNLTFAPQINEHSRRLASARRSSSRISELFSGQDSLSPRRKSLESGEANSDGRDEPAGEVCASMDAAEKDQDDQQELVLPVTLAKINTQPLAGSPPKHGSPAAALPGAIKLPAVKPIKYSFESQLTFTPRLNKNSMRIFAETGKCHESVLDRLTTRRDPEQNEALRKPFSFMPEVSKRSMQMMESLPSTFLSRQQATLERRQKAMSPAMFDFYNLPGRKSLESSPLKKSSPYMAAGAKSTPKTQPKLTPMEAAAANATLNMSTACNLSFSRHYSGAGAADSPKSERKASVSIKVTLKSPTKPKQCVAATPAQPATDAKFDKTAFDGCFVPLKDNTNAVAMAKPSSPSKQVRVRAVVVKKTPAKVTPQSEKPRKTGQAKSELVHAAQSDPEKQVPGYSSEGSENKEEVERATADPVVVSDSGDSDGDLDSPTKAGQPRRRKRSLPKHMDINRVKRVKDKAAQAIKQKRIFAIYGPYPMVRHVLQKRGWIEYEYTVKKGIAAKKKARKKNKDKTTEAASTPSKTATGDQKAKGGGLRDPDQDSDDADDDVDNDDVDTDGADNVDEPPRFPGYEPMTAAEKEEWGMLSRAVRYAHPHFIWSMAKDDIDFKFLEKDQYVNHFREGNAFTTKVGICKNLRHLSWFRQQDPDEFFPRCYILSSEEERQEFIENYRLTAAISILKSYCSGANKRDDISIDGSPKAANKTPTASEAAATASSTSPETSPEIARRKTKVRRKKAKRRSSQGGSSSSLQSSLSDISLGSQRSQTKRPHSSVQPVLLAFQICATYLREKDHDYLDQEGGEMVLTDEQWANLIRQFYLICHGHAIIDYPSDDLAEKGFRLLERLKDVMPQYSVDGTRNVWIVKPGAKSRGRGIVCIDRLDKILALVEGISTLKESKWVVQKYIERPLLIHGTKFDIRQWFLVTDWNPLTLWFYKSSYLRFCGQHFTLTNLSPSIHLANNAIQRHLEVAGCRSGELPDDNMWSSDRFQDYLQEIGEAERWAQIYEGMKDAIIGTLLSMQDIIECRKHSFELYGADFMLTTDYRPWLIEINCSPALSATTKVTGRLCAAVIEDLVKVVIDRRGNKKADTGDFELAFKRPHIAMPSYVGAQLGISGQQIRRQQ